MSDEVWYGQNGEDKAVCDYFARAGGPPGRFLDLGAFAWGPLSNVRRLAERGWGGVLVEADPVCFAGLMRDVTPDRHPGIDLVCAAVLPEAALCRFGVGGGVSTADEAHRAKWAGQVAYRDVYVSAVTPATLLEAFPGPFRLISVDLEGQSVPVFEALPLRAMGVDCVCVEHDGLQSRVLAKCHDAGLTELLASNAENLVVARAWA